MENTLISHSLNRKVLKLGPTNKRSGLIFDNNILISELNDYDMAYNAKEFLFKANTDHGRSILQGLYALIPVKNEHVYVLYTNTVTGLNITRMTQNVWTFKSDAEVEKFLPEMLEQISWVKGSHLVELPINPDFSNKHWIDDFIDPYIYTDFEKVLSQTSMRYHLIKEKNLQQVPFKTDMSLSDFNRYSHYNLQVYEAENKLMMHGLLKYINDECARLNKRKEYFQEQGAFS